MIEGNDLTRTLSDFAVGLQYSNLPVEVVEQTKKYIIDYGAASIAGYKVNDEFNRALLSIIKEDGGAEQSSVLLESRRYPASAAAWMNAAYAHGADMDDGNRKAAGHIGAHVISAVFAVAERERSLWSNVITAINIGYDVFNRVVGASMPGLYNKGFHSTGVGGAMACAAACAKLCGMDSDGVYNAVSLAAVQSSGLIIIDESGQCCKPINPANAARIGVVSADIVRRGVNSPRNPLQSKKGWFNAFCDVVDESVITDGLGKQFTIMESYLKIYPTCRHTHCAIEAALNLRRRMKAKGVEPDSIKAIKLSVYPAAIKSTGSIRYPQSDEEVKFSINYCLATALVKGRFGFEELNPSSSDEANAVIEKIELITDTSLEDRKKGIRGARVELELLDGSFLTETVLIPRGEAAKPFGWDDLEKKMRSCIYGVADDSFAEEVIERVKSIDGNAVFTYPLLFEIAENGQTEV